MRIKELSLFFFFPYRKTFFSGILFSLQIVLFHCILKHKSETVPNKILSDQERYLPNAYPYLFKPTIANAVDLLGKCAGTVL